LNVGTLIKPVGPSIGAAVAVGSYGYLYEQMCT